METLQRTANRGSVATGYVVGNSLKVESDNNEYLERSTSGASDGNSTQHTISVWVKRTQVGVDSEPVSAGGIGRFRFESDDTFSYQFRSGKEIITTRKFRDMNAWYHIVAAADSSQSTASNRMKLYVNGVQETSFGTAVYQDQDQAAPGWGKNTLYSLRVGAAASNTRNFNGYIAEMYYIDGQTLDPTYFGEFDDDSGIWIPKAFTGTHGSLDTYLNFSDSSNLGKNSGGTTDLTSNNITAVDQSTDTCTNNFSTLAGHTHVGNQYGRYVQRHKEGNTQIDEPTGSMAGAWGSHSFSSGKWYWEAKSYLVTSVNMHTFGVASCKNCSGPEDEASGFHAGEATYGLYPSASTGIYPGTGGTTSYKGTTGSSANDNLGANSNGSVWQIAFDADAGKIWFGKNDTWQNTISGTSVSKSDIEAGNNARYEDLNDDAEGPWMPVFGTYNANEGHHIDVNFGGFTAATISSGNTDQNGFGNFEYAPPAGFLAVCSQNLKSVTSIDDPSENFQVTAYTGSGASQTVTNGGNSDLQPDLLWIKNRSAGYAHAIFDSNRGLGSSNPPMLESNSELAENSNQNWVSAVGTDSFTLGVSEHNISNSGSTYVAWQWKAGGGTTASNSNGNITSTVQANTTAGFSIVTWTGDGSTSGKNVGHGLGAVPKMIISKDRGGASNLPGWYIYHPDVGNTHHIQFTSTASADSPTWGDTDPTSSVFSVGGEGAYIATNQSSTNYVAYVFAEKEGYSIFGKYHGNGFHNTAGTYPTGKDGPFIHTGFRPALIFIKRIDNNGSWTIYDEKRDGYNNANDALFWNLTTQEASSNISGSNIDIYSNGFKIKSADNTVNASGGIYIYGAWAAQPQQTSSGIPATAR